MGNLYFPNFQQKKFYNIDHSLSLSSTLSFSPLSYTISLSLSLLLIQTDRLVISRGHLSFSYILSELFICVCLMWENTRYDDDDDDSWLEHCETLRILLLLLRRRRRRLIKRVSIVFKQLAIKLLQDGCWSNRCDILLPSALSNHLVTFLIILCVPRCVTSTRVGN